jgi:hypothetical protein
MDQLIVGKETGGAGFIPFKIIDERGFAFCVLRVWDEFEFFKGAVFSFQL